MRCNQIQNSKVFIAFLGEESNRLVVCLENNFIEMITKT